jgi:hypothetical protein
MPGNDSTAVPPSSPAANGRTYCFRSPKASGVDKSPPGFNPATSAFIYLTPESGNRIHLNRQRNSIKVSIKGHLFSIPGLPTFAVACLLAVIPEGSLHLPLPVLFWLAILICPALRHRLSFWLSFQKGICFCICRLLASFGHFLVCTKYLVNLAGAVRSDRPSTPRIR